MAEQNAVDAGAAANAASGMPTEEPTITINDRAVKLSEAPQVLKDMEHSIKSGYDKKLADERASTASLLKEDIAWYSAHPNPDYWNRYMPKIDGGSGFTGTAAELAEASKEPSGEYTQPETPRAARDTAFGKDPAIAALEAKLARLEEQTTSNSQVTYQSEVNRVAQARDALITKFPNADIELVNLKLQSVLNGSGSHPVNAVIEKIVKESHDATNRRIAAATRGTEGTGPPTQSRSATPAAGGTPANPAPQKALSLDNDRETLKQRIFDKLRIGS